MYGTNRSIMIRMVELLEKIDKNTGHPLVSMPLGATPLNEENMAPKMRHPEKVLSAPKGYANAFRGSGNPLKGDVVISTSSGQVYIVNEVRATDYYIKVGFDSWSDPSRFYRTNWISFPTPMTIEAAMSHAKR